MRPWRKLRTWLGAGASQATATGGAVDAGRRAQMVSLSAEDLIVVALACASALAVGLVDVASGPDLHVGPMYFLPLALAGYGRRKALALAASLFTAVVWLLAVYVDGTRYPQPHFWGVNFVSQSVTFGIVTLLFASLHSRLTDEREAARNDALTGLRNRHGFFEAASGPLALCTRHGRPVALVFIDLDHFKRANDTLGHAAGDDLLREGGRIVQASIRGSDIAARLGGDEFVVLLPETSAGDAAELGRRIGSALEAAPGFRQAGVSASVGVVADPTALCSLSDLLKQADAQMYQAKRAGRRSTAGPLDAATRDEADLLEPPAALTTPG